MYWRIVKPLSVGTGDSDSSRWAAVRATPNTRRRAGVVFVLHFYVCRDDPVGTGRGPPGPLDFHTGQHCEPALHPVGECFERLSHNDNTVGAILREPAATFGYSLPSLACPPGGLCGGQAPALQVCLSALGRGWCRGSSSPSPHSSPTDGEEAERYKTSFPGFRPSPGWRDPPALREPSVFVRIAHAGCRRQTRV